MDGFGRGGGWGRGMTGRVVPAAAVFSGGAALPPDQTSSEIERLRAEKTDLERRLRDLEERLKVAP